MARTKKKIVLLVIGLLVSLFAFKAQCDEFKDREPQFMVFPKTFFSSNAEHVKQFLSSSVLTDVEPDYMGKSSQEPTRSFPSGQSTPSLHQSTPSLSVQEITSTISTPDVTTETVADNYATEQAMASHTISPAPDLPDETTTSHDAQDTIRVASCQESSPSPTSMSDAVQWYIWNNSYYAFVNQPKMNWNEAKETCSLLCEGAHLIFIESEQENQKVSSLAFQVIGQRMALWWIGLSDRDKEGSWKWENVPMTYSSWHKGEPNNDGKGEDCVNLKSRDDENALWNDVPCRLMRHFICEKNIVTADT